MQEGALQKIEVFGSFLNFKGAYFYASGAHAQARYRVVCLCVCVCVCVECYSCSTINEVQARLSTGFAK